MVNRAVVMIPLVIVLLLVLIGAVVVVVKNAGRVQVGPAPVVFGPIPTDTTMARQRSQLQKGIERLERRLTEYRRKVDRLAVHQDSLFQLCTSGLARLWNEFAELENVDNYAERKERFAKTREDYVRLREVVTDFVRSIDSMVSKARIDSLDEEFKRLIQE
ncbi:MAG: hypothetical protein ACUVUR_07425 [bacterium]